MSGPACCAACLVSPSTLYVYPAPRGQRYSVCVRTCAQTTATAAPDCNTSSKHQQQQQQRRFASVIPSLGNAAGQPCSCCCGEQDVSHSSSNTVGATLSGNAMQFFFDHINNSTVITFTDILVEGVTPCLGFECHVGTHIHTTVIGTFRTGRCDLPEKLETNSETKQHEISPRRTSQ